MLRIGLLGASRIAPTALIPQVAKRDDCKIVAASCRDVERGEAYILEHAIERCETSYEALVEADDIDIVYNALPPNRHKDLTIRALKAGKHVLCEKPFAMNAAEAQEMADAASTSGTVLLEAFHYRFHPAFERVLDIVRDGRLGTLREMESVFTVTIPNRDGELRHDPALGGGSLMDLGCYCLHALRSIAGGEPAVERAVAEDNGKGADMGMEAYLTFPGGVSAHIHSSMREDIEFEASVKLTGEKGILHYANFVHPHKGHQVTMRVHGQDDVETVDGDTTYDHQLDHFIRLVKGEAEPVLPPSDAVANMALIDAIYAAAGMDR
ncbi:Gfo/Idh/MocA family oxidoreductase [Parvularcula flava]|uniref:Oxidoreductase n=1 Tax=Aquisalinus luteolus TaxID=1566827 RepID=A0A8J3ETW3_9PROT|nr:Gfo/Idh/MocA family oxidoreductase [Aquisalinus luteolus]NHK27391.1 Gfo/Idh/MocA family oxidoreductase [Aquisalinus luteolus]GGH95294.1 oxidoreductase [Aquisalinus luteolus]